MIPMAAEDMRAIALASAGSALSFATRRIIEDIDSRILITARVGGYNEFYPWSEVPGHFDFAVREHLETLASEIVEAFKNQGYTVLLFIEFGVHISWSAK